MCGGALSAIPSHGSSSLSRSVGSLAVGFVRPELLEIALGTELVAVTLTFLRATQEIRRLDRGVARDFGGDAAETCLHTVDGEEVCYTGCNRGEARVLAGLGALSMGMFSTGLGELNVYFLLSRCRVPIRVAVATRSLVVAITALSPASTHVWRFVQTGRKALPTLLSLTMFWAGFVGGQLGPRRSARLSQHVLERGLGGLFLLVGL